LCDLVHSAKHYGNSNNTGTSIYEVELKSHLLHDRVSGHKPFLKAQPSRFFGVIGLYCAHCGVFRWALL